MQFIVLGDEAETGHNLPIGTIVRLVEDDGTSWKLYKETDNTDGEEAERYIADSDLKAIDEL